MIFYQKNHYYSIRKLILASKYFLKNCLCFNQLINSKVFPVVDIPSFNAINLSDAAYVIQFWHFSNRTSNFCISKIFLEIFKSCLPDWWICIFCMPSTTTGSLMSIFLGCSKNKQSNNKTQQRNINSEHFRFTQRTKCFKERSLVMLRNRVCALRVLYM